MVQKKQGLLTLIGVLCLGIENATRALAPRFDFDDDTFITVPEFTMNPEYAHVYTARKAASHWRMAVRNVAVVELTEKIDA